jgi:L,D-peptidoglycan transpeptidase YkuD (ErfK/YbiS/YcfS/YnhG family)
MRLVCTTLVVAAIVLPVGRSVVRSPQPRDIGAGRSTAPVTASAVAASVAATAVAATAGSPARRTTGPQPVSACQQIAFNIGSHHPAATQVIVVLTASAGASSGSLQVADLGSHGWVCGGMLPARVGRSGVRPLLARRSGDGTTPAGVFPLGTMTAWDGQAFSFFGNSADPGVSVGAYRRVRAGDCFGATPNDPDYGHLVYRTPAGCAGPDDEYLPSITGAYEHAALIGANMEPEVSGDAPGEVPYASAIFLHRFSLDASGGSKPTSGCVSVSHSNLVDVLRAMQPGVMFAIGETAWLLANS